MIAAHYPGGSGAASATLFDGGVATPLIARSARTPLRATTRAASSPWAALVTPLDEAGGESGRSRHVSRPVYMLLRRPWARGVCAARCRLHSISSKRHDTSWQMGVALHQLALQGGPR